MDGLKLNTLKESIRAPGLPYPPKANPFDNIRGVKSKFIPVLSLNYDYLFTNLESPKMFWIDLSFPPPRDLKIGNPVKVHITPNRGIQTTLYDKDSWNSIFEIDDIVGSRIVLSPYKGSTWLPTNHEQCDSPFGWGYNTEWVNVSTSMHNPKYGYGAPVTTLEYKPLVISPKQLDYEAARMLGEWYHGGGYYPGW